MSFEVDCDAAARANEWCATLPPYVPLVIPIRTNRLSYQTQYDGEEPVEEVFGLTFAVDTLRRGRRVVLPLKPGDTAVDEEARKKRTSRAIAYQDSGLGHVVLRCAAA